MAWLRVQLTEEEQSIVNEERTSHPNERIRERMLVLWSLHSGVTRQKAAEIDLTPVPFDWILNKGAETN